MDSLLREFLHVDNLADAVVFMMVKYSGLEHWNVGSGKDDDEESGPSMVAVKNQDDRYTYKNKRAQKINLHERV
ncbi:unnamed protein product [Lupinus luteus]|uniref:Uncharacterized protein n=1 Tax=Lupinus luteus TaxID=3873 RepID=A0AAV1WUH1_LUPLU